MGREVRRVPPNWKHPKDENGHDQAMFDQTYEQACDEWIAGFNKWEDGEDPIQEKYKDTYTYYWEYYGGPPENKEFYRPWKDEEATWWQVWQTVSEGSPVTPPFETKEELIEYLSKYGDEWDQNRGNGGWGVERARAFVESGWAPSGMIIEGRFLESKDCALAIEKDRE